MNYGRRETDAPVKPERSWPFRPIENGRVPGWAEQRAQFFTRYLFWALGLAYFNLGSPPGRWPDLATINIGYSLYFLANSAFMMHAYYHARAPLRWRLAMWTDILFVSFSLVADTSPVPPALVAYIAVVLGNGMRYGMRFFREAVVGSIFLGGIAFYFYYTEHLRAINIGTLFLIIFGVIIILYAYALMDRIDRIRRQLEADRTNDALTGLLNRRALFEIADTLFRQLERGGKRLAVLFADVNKFKTINDTLGHSTGDRVLADIARVIAGSTRKSDITARYGGDEFVLILPESSAEKAAVLARRLQENLRTWAQTERIELSMSMGVGEAPRHGTDLRSVLDSVDKAMYRSKAAGESGGIQFVDDMAPESRHPI